MLVGVLAHRPERLKDCLWSLAARARAPFRCVVHWDGNDPAVGEILKGDLNFKPRILHSPERVGIAAGLNKILRLRDRGEDFVRVDGDVAFLSGGWIPGLVAASEGLGLVGPIWTGNTWDSAVRGWLEGHSEPSPGVLASPGPPLGGVVYHPGHVVDKLGGYRSHGGFYGCQERDYHARVKALGLEAGYATGVWIDHPPVGALKRPRRGETEEALKALKRKVASDYSAGNDLFEPLLGFS